MEEKIILFVVLIHRKNDIQKGESSVFFPPIVQTEAVEAKIFGLLFPTIDQTITEKDRILHFP